MGKRKTSVEQIERHIRNLSKLSTLPYIAAKVVELVENPKTSASTLGKIISMDQVLAARILKLANSAYYGFPRQISTINLAIVVLGFNTLRDLVLSISVINQFSLNKNEKIAPKQFWRHALVVGMGARAFSRFINYPIPGEVFVGGLLHDIGLLVLIQEFPDVLNEVSEYMEEKNFSFESAMESILGVNSATLGGWLADGWNLPPNLARAIRYHQSPQNDPHHSQLAWMIHLADLLSGSIGETNGSKFSNCPESQLAEEKLNWFFKTDHPLSYFQDQFKRELDKVNDFLGLLTNGELN